MKNWTIGKRITFGFVVMLVIPLTLGLFARSRVGAIQRESENVIKNGIPSIELLGRVQSRMKENDTLLYRHIWCPDGKGMQALEGQITANCEANGKDLDVYDKLLNDDRARASFEKIKEVRARFNESLEKILAASHAATNNELSKEVYDRANAEVLPLSQSYEKAIMNVLKTKLKRPTRQQRPLKQSPKAQTAASSLVFSARSSREVFWLSLLSTAPTGFLIASQLPSRMAPIRFPPLPARCQTQARFWPRAPANRLLPWKKPAPHWKKWPP